MLSKSQARLFFFIATVGFSGVFLWLTVDSLRQVDKRSNADELTAEVVRGKEIWEANNCMGCHTILGEGAYYAPELTKVVDRRGRDWIRLFLRDPQAMYPGRRKMVQYDFSEDQIGDVIAFLEWVGNIDTNGFPREPDLEVVQGGGVLGVWDPSYPEMFRTICVSCHSYGGMGGKVGPALDDISDRFDEATLRTWLADPQAVKPGTAMPKLVISDEQLDELTAFLMASNANSER